MRRKVTFSLMAAIFIVACSSTATIQQTPKPTAQKQGEEGIKARFRKAYAELACLANPGVDPQMNVVPLHNPGDFLKRVQKSDPAQFSLAMEILKKYGFFTVDSFFDTMRTLKMDAEHWNSVENGFIDDLEKCK